MTVAPVPAEELVAHWFRRSSGQMVATLTRMFGSHNLELCEDVVQDALLKALQEWPYAGIPANPFAWLVQVAKNSALDTVRRKQRHLEKAADALLAWEAGDATEPGLRQDEIDDVLSLAFLCAHPRLAPEASVVLALKTVAGFGVAEIAAALFLQESAVYQRLLRAKRQIRELGLTFELSAQGLAPRLETVLQVLYLWFNEGYRARSGSELVRMDLCREAIHLTEMLARHAVLASPTSDALLALMYFQAARFSSRADALGSMLLLKDQDRASWDRALINAGLVHLDRSARGQALTRYHLEAGIAACHVVAPTYADTDWEQIVELYEQLLRLAPSPIVRLNHCVAISRLRGPRAALPLVKALRNDPFFRGYSPVDAILGHLARELGDFRSASKHFSAALAGDFSDPERRCLSACLDDVRAKLGPVGVSSAGC
ncbi:MAG: RNA polymerase sigma factor [Myxococcota bacterium]